MYTGADNLAQELTIVVIPCNYLISYPAPRFDKIQHGLNNFS